MADPREGLLERQVPPRVVLERCVPQPVYRFVLFSDPGLLRSETRLPSVLVVSRLAELPRRGGSSGGLVRELLLPSGRGALDLS